MSALMCIDEDLNDGREAEQRGVEKDLTGPGLRNVIDRRNDRDGAHAGHLDTADDRRRPENLLTAREDRGRRECDSTQGVYDLAVHRASSSRFAAASPWLDRASVRSQAHPLFQGRLAQQGSGSNGPLPCSISAPSAQGVTLVMRVPQLPRLPRVPPHWPNG